jgi:glyoxylase-like metal-dependent hydrolase (beta-lactamase superfamily II)
MLTVQSLLFSPVQENTYLVYNEAGDTLIIDPGCYFPEERKSLEEKITAKGLKPIQLVNTHCHLDHVFGNKFVHETWGLELYFHESEQKVFDYASTAGDLWNLPFEILHTPGHSPGSISFYYQKGGWVISGDVLFRESVGRTDLPGSDFSTLEQSIRTKLYTLPDNTHVYSGHGMPTTIGYEKANNPFVPAG